MLELVCIYVNIITKINNGEKNVTLMFKAKVKIIMELHLNHVSLSGKHAVGAMEFILTLKLSGGAK